MKILSSFPASDLDHYLIIIAAKTYEKLRKTHLPQFTANGSIMRNLAIYSKIQKARKDFQFPYGSPHHEAPEWLYRAVWEYFFLYGFWSWSLFGLYCKATRFSLLFEIFDFGNSRGSYFEFMVFKQGIRIFICVLPFRPVDPRSCRKRLPSYSRKHIRENHA